MLKNKVTQLKCKVNGKEIALRSGKLLTALRAAGHDIPSVCFHADLPHSGGRCRVCVCNVNGRLSTPCNIDVVEGMEVVTDTPQLMNLRKAALALVPHLPQEVQNPTLSEAAIKDPKSAFAAGAGMEKKAGCLGSTVAKLADTRGTFLDFPTLEDIKKGAVLHKGAKKYIIRHPELCTHCGLCVQMCQHVQGVGAIADVRGHDVEKDLATNEEVAQQQGEIGSFGKSVPLTATECINCGQCINVCPYGALEEVSEVDEVQDAIKDASKQVVFQFAPAVRIALAEEFGYAPGTRSLTHEMVAATRKIGEQAGRTGDKTVKVFDTNFTADLTIIEEGYELLERLRRVLTGQKKYGGDHMYTALPMITSCSPGWVMFAEKNYHDLLPNLSSCKSPQQMHGAVTKHFWGKTRGMKPKDIVVVSVMPCVAKKGEKDRPEFSDTEGTPDIDHVLTTREFAKLLRNNNIDPTKLNGEDFDDPMDLGSGAGVIFGATGGVMEAALRTAYEVVTGREVPFHHLDITPVRGMEGVREASIPIDHVLPEWSFLEGVQLKIAIAHGIGNARKLMDRVRERQERGLPPEFHFIEVMGCPGGCVGGGGQPKPTSMEVKTARAKLIYTEDANLPLRKSHDNPAVKRLYEILLKEPLGHASHELLHTFYTPRAPVSVGLLGTEESKEIRTTILYKYPKTRSRLTNMLDEIVDKYGFVSDAAVATVANYVNATPVDIDSIITHYHYFLRQKPKAPSMIYLCECLHCRLHGSGKVKAWLKEKKIPYHMTSWLGWCVNGAPAALIKHAGDSQVHAITNLKPGDARLENLSGFSNPLPELTYKVLTADRLFGGDSPSVLRDINLTPEDREYLAREKKCPVSRKLYAMNPDDVVKQLKVATLRGCGGAGFPTFFKWDAVRKQPTPVTGKYVVINADEGLPNTFKDYHLMQNDHCRMRMVSGACFAAHTVGADHIVLYLRYEYKNLKQAILDSFEKHKLMNSQTRKGLTFEVVVGGGPYVCGEETALFESVEGHMPQARCERTLFPTQHGLFGAPTLVGNVETFSWIPGILYRGGDHFASVGGQPDQRGVKLISISGDVATPVLAEYPMGHSVRQILEESAGIPLSEIAAVEVGGAMEALIFPDEFDRVISLDNKGDHLPAGGSIVVFKKNGFNERAVYEAKAKFANIESCQLCAPCREGTRVMRSSLNAIFDGHLLDDEEQTLKIKEMIQAMEMSSNCGHGKACGKMNRLLLDRVTKLRRDGRAVDASAQ